MPSVSHQGSALQTEMLLCPKEQVPKWHFTLAGWPDIAWLRKCRALKGTERQNVCYIHEVFSGVVSHESMFFNSGLKGSLPPSSVLRTWKLWAGKTGSDVTNFTKNGNWSPECLSDLARVTPLDSDRNGTKSWVFKLPNHCLLLSSK